MCSLYDGFVPTELLLSLRVAIANFNAMFDEWEHKGYCETSEGREHLRARAKLLERQADIYLGNRKIEGASYART